MAVDEFSDCLRQEKIVGDRSDFFRFTPIVLELTQLSLNRCTLRFFVSGHLERESQLFRKLKQPGVLPALTLPVSENPLKCFFG
jgi:hypothetical protein